MALLEFIACSVFAVVSCSGDGVAAAPKPAFDAGAQAKVDRVAAAAIAGGYTGITIGIDDPKLGYMVKAYGKADTAGTALTAEMHYRIASVTKTFTAYAVLRLIEAGTVALDDPISKYVPGFPHGASISIGELLSMRGGVFDFVHDATFDKAYEADPTLPGWTPEKTLAVVDQHVADFTPPDKKTVYSNTEYVLLGLVIQKVTGQTVEAYLTSLLSTLGLDDTSFPVAVDLPDPYSHGYLKNPQAALRDVTPNNPAVSWTSGGMISTVPDMLKYAAELGTGVGMSPATFKLRQTWGPLTTKGLRLQYGLGLLRLGNWLGHNGSIFGYTDDVYYLPSARASIVVMVNQSSEPSPADTVWRDVVKQLYPDSLSSWP